MKKHILMLAVAVMTLPAMADYKAEFNTEEATAINITEGGQYRIYNDLFSQTGVPIIVSNDIADTVFITLEDVNIVPDSEGSAMVIGENSIVVLNLGGTETETDLKGKDTGCGIEVLGDLIINGNDDNTLSCKGAGRAAAIGTNGKSAAAGSITINGGNIIAKSGSESAGIGASNAGRLGDITINGGYVQAIGGAYSSAIGGSYVSKGTATITINGGVVEAQAGYYCNDYSIGRGNGTHSGTVSVVILGGSIIAKDKDGKYEGTTVGKIYNPTNNNEDVVLFTYTLAEHPSTLITEGHIGTLQLGTDYGINDVYTDENGVLYFYLPESAKGKEVVINGITISETTPDQGGEGEGGDEGDGDKGDGDKDPDGEGVINTYGEQTDIDIVNTVDGIIINNTANNLVTICELTGKTVLQSTVSDNQPITLTKGLYIVRVNTVGNFKCIVK